MYIAYFYITYYIPCGHVSHDGHAPPLLHVEGEPEGRAEDHDDQLDGQRDGAQLGQTRLYTRNV